MKTVRYYLRVSVAALVAAIACPSCNDTWDDHYDVQGELVNGTAGASLWENLNKDEELSPFNSVLKACGYDVILNSSQVYTVWAPVITDAEAKEWIKIYEAETAAGRTDEQNAAIKEFVMNHVALYNHQINDQTSDTVQMKNGKYMSLTWKNINGDVAITDVRVPSRNGMLYKIGGSLPYFRNVWEAIQADSVGVNALDSVARFFMQFEEEMLDLEESVPGDMDSDGNQHYVDSVIDRTNTFFSGSSLFTSRRRAGYIDSEDSLYYFLAPTNRVWEEKVEEYKKYFICAHDATSADKLAQYRDSLQTLYAKAALIEGCFFNVRRQADPTMQDSICSTLWSGTANVTNYTGAYKFDKPFASDGIFDGGSYAVCSNGRLYKSDDWKILPEKTFIQTIKIEAESSMYRTIDETNMTISTESQENDAFKVSGGQYILLSDNRTATYKQPSVTFDIPNTLSNCPYDIYVVFATPLANSDLSTDTQDRLVSFGLNYYVSESTGFLANPVSYRTNVVVDGTKMDTVQVTKDQVFIPRVCNFPFEADERVQLTVSSRVRRTQNYSERLAIDCVIFKPRLTDENDGE